MSSYKYSRTYTGKISGIIFDWAGTTMDYGCMSPVIVFLKVFEKAGVPITMEEARVPMGLHKKVHIEKVTQISTVRKRWKEKHGVFPNSEDVEKMFSDFVPLQLECLSQHSTLIPGTLEIISKLRARNYKIGSTTGFTTEMMEVVKKDAEEQGYKPDSIVCASEVPAGRPYPFMALQNMINLELSPSNSVVKIDDTTPGIEEGLNAGCWTIGLALSGNDVGLTLDEWKSLPQTKKKYLSEKAYQKHLKAGAHYVVDDITQIIPCLDDIERRLSNGEHP